MRVKQAKSYQRGIIECKSVRQIMLSPLELW